MNKSNLKERRKFYPVQDFPLYVVSEPEEVYMTKPGMSYDEDFDGALASAISSDEFRARIYKEIESWPWENR